MLVVSILLVVVALGIIIGCPLRVKALEGGYLEKKRYESDEDYKKRLAEVKAAKEPEVRFVKIFSFTIAAFLILVALAISTVRFVPTGEVGIKTSFGTVSGRADEGLNLIAPWEEITPMNIRIQKQSFKGLSASTKDAQAISNIDIDVNYRLNPEKAEEVYSTIGKDYNDTLISPLLTQYIKDRLAVYNAESLVTERNKIVDDITSQLQGNLKDYGVDVVAVSLVNYDFSKDFNAALEKKAVAQKEIETAKNAQEKAKVEAETNRIKAEQLTEPILMEKLIDAIRNGNGTYVVDTNNMAIGINNK